MRTGLLSSPAVLPEAGWTARQRAHEERVEPWVGPHQQRRHEGRTHPVLDFLFTYYSHTPGRLRRWHPQPGQVLLGEAARERLDWPFHTRVAVRDDRGRETTGVALDVPAFLARRRDAVAWMAGLLRATAGRPAAFGCFGLHEWAMVYRPEDGAVRHDAVPLRLGAAGTAAVVDSSRVQCSHVDAFRFFTPRARPLNTLQPTRETQVALEQPGCLHATMDLYKWAYKLAPATPGELVADCFELAADVREMDMRASPYDLTELGHPPVRIETAEGKAEYVAAQRDFTARGAGLRARLLAVCEDLLAAG
ncbi:MAG: 3-methyladenine glycosylase [Modestobacter sp.]|nr:3-methyladenine glycosylase [Modestobacter sp.]